MKDYRKVYFVAEDRWVTIKGTHVLVGDKGNIKNDNLRNKIGGEKKSEE